MNTLAPPLRGGVRGELEFLGWRAGAGVSGHQRLNRILNVCINILLKLRIKLCIIRILQPFT